MFIYSSVLSRVSLVFVFSIVTNGENPKRLLINDPEAMNARLTKLEHMIEQQNTRMQTMERAISNFAQNSVTGSIYTIWGKNTCPNNNDTETVYTGYVVGGIKSDIGSSQDLLCLTSSAEFEKTSGASDYGRVYGAEYDSDFYKTHANGEDIPCTVCQRHGTIASVMIPGRKSCFQGWNREYYGYLSTGYHAHKDESTKYICIDIDPDFLVGGETDTELGRMLGPVVSKCGTLRCPPYHENYAVTCVVCSK